jgi:hypothetical protein
MWAFSEDMKLAIMIAALVVYAGLLSAAGALWMSREFFWRRRRRPQPGATPIDSGRCFKKAA